MRDLALHFADFVIFKDSQTSNLVSSPKIPKNYESQAKNPFVVDSNAQNLVKNNLSLRGRIADSHEVIQRNLVEFLESNANPCNFERSEKSLLSLREMRSISWQSSNNLGESKIFITLPLAPSAREGETLECGASPQPPLTFCIAKSKQKTSNLGESSTILPTLNLQSCNDLGDSRESKSWGFKGATPPCSKSPSARMGLSTSPSPFGRGLGGGENSQNPQDSREYTNLSKSQNFLDCHENPYRFSRNDKSMQDSRKSKPFFAYFFSKKVSGDEPKLKNIISPSRFAGDGLGGGVKSANSLEFQKIFRFVRKYNFVLDSHKSAIINYYSNKILGKAL